MQNIEELHTKAMDLAEEAFLDQKRGAHFKAISLFKTALNLEQKAASLLPLAKNSEPTRSLLYRSAASIAYYAGEYEIADRLIANGLAGYPPNEIKNELKNLYVRYQDSSFNELSEALEDSFIAF